MWHRSLTVGVAALALGACTAPITTQVNVTDPAPAELRVETLAMLPLTVDPGLEPFGRDAGEELYASLTTAYPQLQVVPASQALQRLANAGVTDEYANLIARYEETGQLDPRILRELGDAVGSRYMLNVRLTYAEEAGYGPGDFAGNIEYRGQGMRVIAQLWDGERGVLEWRTVGDVTAVSSDLMRERSVTDLLRQVLPEIAARVPIEGGDPLAQAVPVRRGPEDRTVFMGASGLLLLAFLLL